MEININRMYPNSMQKFLLASIFLVFSTFVKAQQVQQVQDSLNQKTELGIKEKFPRMRILNFEYGQSLSRNFDSELLGQEFQDGEIKSHRTFKATANVPLYKTQKWGFRSSFNYQFNEFEFNDLDFTSENVFGQNGIANFHNFSVVLTTNHFSTLFKTPVIYNASLIVDGNEKGLERVKGLVGLSFILKKTQRTTMMLGAMVFIDRTSPLPFFPTFSYNHHFKNPKWELDFVLPQQLLLRRTMGENGRLSIGSSFGGNGFYVNPENSNFKDTYEYSQLEIKSGIIYEHRFNDFLIGTFQGGVQHFINNRLTEKGEPTSDFIYKNNQDPTGYFQVGISINPFAKKK